MCKTLEDKLSKLSCKHCALRQMLVRAGLDRQDSDAVQQLGIRCRGPFDPGEHIYRACDATHSLYVITAGAVKTEVVTAEGDVQVTGFYLPGQAFGFECVGDQDCPVAAIALERTWACEVRVGALEALGACFPRLQHELLVLLANEIRNMGYRRMLVRNLPAEQRLLCFIKSLQRRLSTHLGTEVCEVPLPMSKEDIAKYLSLAPETLSRALVRLGRSGVIRNKARSIELLDAVTVSTVPVCD